MNILKTKKLFTYMVVGALVMALSISCKSNEDPNSGDTKKEDQKTQEKTFASYAGTWWGDFGKGVEEALITINTDGSFIVLGSNEQIPSSDITKSSDTSYTAIYQGMTMIFNFSSDNQATVDFGGGGGNQVPINRK